MIRQGNVYVHSYICTWPAHSLENSFHSSLQVQVELRQEVQEGGLDHPECLQPLFIISGVLDYLQPPVLSGPVDLEALGLEAQEGKGGTSSGILEPIISVPAGVQSAGWGPGDSCATVVALR
ncbi:hypothetical protein Y1Q_0006776 [Alligator mississippiensis]|uniref:Uncharacterized protein n=1 Tax=Alligator mississippiensis TaxID=8496 RepID=A0A151NWU5_ALLMI|nr:hypothetical protein Y1Q_0006776 [Alligator mississippiensis]